MKKIFYILALGIGLAGCSNNEDELLPTGGSSEARIISVITEVNEPLSRAGYDATNLERFGLMIRNAENAAYNYHKQMVGSGNVWHIGRSANAVGCGKNACYDDCLCTLCE